MPLAPSVSYAPIWKYNSNTEIGLRSTSITDAIGNSGGLTITGGTASGDDLTLESTSDGTKGTIICISDIDLQSATPSVLFTDTTGGHDNWEIAVEADDFTIKPDATPAEGRIILDAGISFYPNYDDNTTSTFNILDFNPTLTTDGPLIHKTLREGATVESNNILGIIWSCISSGMNLTFSVNPLIATYQLFNSNTTIDTTVAAGVLPPPAYFASNNTVQATNVTATCSLIEEFTGLTLVSGTGASGDITLTDYITFRSRCRLSTDNGGGNATITTRIGLEVLNPTSSGAGAEDMGTQIGVDLQDLDFATTNISFRSQGAATEMRHAGPAMFGANAAPAGTVEIQSSDAEQLLTLDQNATTSPFIDFQGTAGADTTSSISDHNTSGSTTHHIQIELFGTTKAWIAVSTNNPSA